MSAVGQPSFGPLGEMWWGPMYTSHQPDWERLELRPCSLHEISLVGLIGLSTLQHISFMWAFIWAHWFTTLNVVGPFFFRPKRCPHLLHARTMFVFFYTGKTAWTATYAFVSFPFQTLLLAKRPLFKTFMQTLPLAMSQAAMQSTSSWALDWPGQ